MTFLANRRIAKMNGIGNAIAVLDLCGSDHIVSAAEARAIHRAPGLAFDQLMVLTEPRSDGSAARLTIYNNDGSVSDTCGNGTRCVAYLLMGAARGNELLLESDAGPLGSEARRKRFGGQLLHRLQRLAGREAGCGVAVDFDRREAVVARDAIWPRTILEGGH